MTLSQLRAFLREIDRSPNQQLSQHFLIDKQVTWKIVELANIAPGDQVLEIGPGPGALTSCLLEAGAKVYAIEKDPSFARTLSRLQTPSGQLVSISADFLKFDLSSLPSSLKVVSNLPYHITTPILERLFEHRKSFSTLTLMVQREVAARMTAPAGSKHCSSLNLFVQFHAILLDSLNVAASCFYPKPKVQSKVVHLAFYPPPLQESGLFFSMVRRAFQQRRKMIRVSLRSSYPVEALENALLVAQAKVDARPETLSLKQWLTFYQEVSRSCLERGAF